MLKPRPFNRLRFIRGILYGITAIFYFLMIGSDIYGGSVNVGSFILNRCPLYIVEAVLLSILYIRSRKTPEQFNGVYFKNTVRFKQAADTCFMMIIIVTVFAVGELIPVIVYLSNDIFHGAANGPLALLPITGVTSALHFFVARKFYRLEEQNELLKPPPPEEDDFYAFIHSNDAQQEETAETEPSPEDMPDVTDLSDEAVPDGEELQRHLRQIALLSRNCDPIQLWECPLCGSLNSDGSGRCEFCGADRENKAFSEQRKEENDD